jgi:NAD-dependent dihydropyrimidine dehydrogenase PreA subunit
MGVFAEQGDVIAVVEPNQCIICRACEATCPSDSIVVED